MEIMTLGAALEKEESKGAAETTLSVFQKRRKKDAQSDNTEKPSSEDVWPVIFTWYQRMPQRQLKGW